MRSARRKYVLPVLMLCALACALAGCSGEKRYSVILICVDTLRPDRLGCNGYARNTSPGIDKLAREGIRFNTCYSASGWTLPSMATILTGVYPKDHGATDFHWSMDPGVPTLASILRREGYDTRAYVSHVFLKPIYGFGEGFRSFDFSVLNMGHPHEVSTAKELTDLVTADLPETKKPFFIWAHYFDPHFAYLSHPEWAKFGDTDSDRYDQEVAFTDHHIARLLDALDRRGLADETIVVFTSDHGEEFGEHGGAYHDTLHEEVMRCALVIRAPFLDPGVNETVAEQIDFVPTILALLKIPIPDGLPGKDLFSGRQSGPIFFERDRPFPWAERGVLEGHDKLIVVEVSDSTKIPEASHGNYAPVLNVVPGVYMYDLSQDPGERRNVYDESNPRSRELLSLLARQFTGPERKKTRQVEVNEELTKKLRSLGYIR